MTKSMLKIKTKKSVYGHPRTGPTTEQPAIIGRRPFLTKEELDEMALQILEGRKDVADEFGCTTYVAEAVAVWARLGEYLQGLPKNKKTPGGRHKITEREVPVLRSLLKEHPGMSYPQLAQLFFSETGILVNRATVARACWRYGLRKKG